MRDTRIRDAPGSKWCLRIDGDRTKASVVRRSGNVTPPPHVRKQVPSANPTVANGVTTMKQKVHCVLAMLMKYLGRAGAFLTGVLAGDW